MARKMKTMDGNNAAAHVSYAYTDLAAIYPITPSSVMAEVTDKWASEDKRNIFGEKVRVVEMQSEAGAAGTVHGSLAAGALTTTFTASQGLLLMIPNMYKIAGELLPGVINVSARAVASHALSIFGDHSDVYACRQTGFAMLCESSPQEVMDLTPVAHCAAIKGRVPFLNFFDGFRTSHELQKIEIWDYEDLKDMVDMDDIQAFRDRSLNPNRPVLRGTAQNPDIFFQAREACNTYYDAVPTIVEEYMGKVNKKIGTNYQLFNYYGAPDAEHVVIAMGSVCETIEETIDYLNAAGGKYGLVRVRLYRPFSAAHLISAIPDSVKLLTVLDRTKEPGSLGEPLWLDVVAALKGTKFDQISVLSGRYGLGSKDTTPAQIISVYKNSDKKRFTIGIEDDVTHLSLPITENPDTTPADIISCKFWGLGADGTVGANKNSIKIIGDHTDMNAQAYFAYDSKKSGGVTISHLRFGKSKIKSTYLINKANFVACHTPAYISRFPIVEDVKPGGVFLLNCQWSDEELNEHLPASVKRLIANNNIRFYTIDGIAIGKEIGLGGRINTVLQSAFFKLANILPAEDAIRYMKDAATASYSKKGEAIVKMNHDAIDRGAEGVHEVKIPDSWKTASDQATTVKATGSRKNLVDFVNDIVVPVNDQRGDSLPVSTFMGDRTDGTFPQGTAAYEKRGIAVDVPTWIPDNCIQCGFCSYVCPHAVIRLYAMTEEEAAKAPNGLKSAPMTGMADKKFAIGISALDCAGCGACAAICPGKKGEKALVMNALDNERHEQKNYNFLFDLPEKADVMEKFKESTVKGSQFKQPLLEFSGACAGCGETPYAKLVTQLYGERMYIANATGCSSIWGGSAPATPYTVNKSGFGPAWANSLFEDNAEYGYGMFLAQDTIRQSLVHLTEELIAIDYCDGDLKEAGKNWLATYENGALNGAATKAYIAALKDGVETIDGCLAFMGTPTAKEVFGDKFDEMQAHCKALKESGAVYCDCEACTKALAILSKKDYLAKKSVWVFGGDGWAYDIGFGGLDHVIASHQDVNILVFDTEVYSNTGGQSSKATPTGAVAQFAAAGKEVKKKDLAAIAMSYGYVYTAQVAMGADRNQCLKALLEAESYNGPSLVIAYAPCINHGIKGGMVNAQNEEKKAVDSGYWHLFRFDPRLSEDGKNPFQLDSKAPTASYKDFIMSEVRYSSLARSNPSRAEVLFDSAAKTAADKYDHLVSLAKGFEEK